MTDQVWEPPEYSVQAGDPPTVVCNHCGVAVVDVEKHTKWHFRDSVRGRDSYGSDLRVTEQQVRDYFYDA